MLRRIARPQPDRELELTTEIRRCPGCDGPLWAAYKNRRSLITLDGVTRLGVQVRRCRDRECPRFGMPIRPEAEGKLALPQSEFGLDVIALVAARLPLPASQHPGDPRRVDPTRRADLHAERRQPAGSLRRTARPLAVRSREAEAGRRGGRAGDPGHRRAPARAVSPRGPSGSCATSSAARSSWPGASCPRAGLTWPSSSPRPSRPSGSRGKEACRSPGVISDGQHSIRDAVAQALPGVPHQLCQFHYLPPGGRPVYEADRHAKVQLKKKVCAASARIERAFVEGRGGPGGDGDPRLCRRGPLVVDRRRPAAAGGPGPEVARSAGQGGRQPG